MSLFSHFYPVFNLEQLGISRSFHSKYFHLTLFIAFTAIDYNPLNLLALYHSLLHLWTRRSLPIGYSSFGHPYLFLDPPAALSWVSQPFQVQRGKYPDLLFLS